MKACEREKEVTVDGELNERVSQPSGDWPSGCWDPSPLTPEAPGGAGSPALVFNLPAALLRQVLGPSPRPHLSAAVEGPVLVSWGRQGQDTKTGWPRAAGTWSPTGREPELGGGRARRPLDPGGRSPPVSSSFWSPGRSLAGCSFTQTSTWRSPCAATASPSEPVCACVPAPPFVRTRAVLDEGPSSSSITSLAHLQGLYQVMSHFQAWAALQRVSLGAQFNPLQSQTRERLSPRQTHSTHGP